MTEEKTNLSVGELSKLRQIDFSDKTGFVNASKMLDREIGKRGSKKREEFDAKARAWYYGEVLRDRRKELGLTQKELAERIGRERTYINRVEQGETDLQLSSFIRIADALGIKLLLEANPV